MIGSMQSIVRKLMRTLRPDSRNLLAVSLLLAGPNRQPRPIDAWPERKVLVLAPHADDEVIGCGGAVALHARSGAEVTVVVVTDGSIGDLRLHDRTLGEAERAAITAEVVETRRTEARAAATLLGIAAPEFLDAPDGRLQADAATVSRLAAVLERTRPELVYLPFVMDQHEDHWQSNNLFAAALQTCGAWTRQLVIRGYEVWAPLVANRLADITEVSPVKHAALGAYASQLRDRDYSSAVRGLNSYRAMHLPVTDQREAEAFFECSERGYLHLMANIRGRTPPVQVQPDPAQPRPIHPPAHGAPDVQ